MLYNLKVRSLFIPLLFLLPLTAFSQLSDKNYRVYATGKGKEINLTDIVKEMKNYDVLFFGEEHNDSVTHYVQSVIFELLFETYGDKTALSLEMFDRDVQFIMDEYLEGMISEKHFIKDSRAWKNYRDYKPMVEFAKSQKLDVVCANAPTRYTNLAGRKGQDALANVPAVSKNYFAPLPYDTASGAYYEKLAGLSHAAPPPATAVNDTSLKSAPVVPVMAMGNFNMIMAQSLWDATMAYSIAEYLKNNKGKKIMQVNGRFHSDEGFAAVTQLKKYLPGVRILIISSASDESFPVIDWSKYTSQGDFIIITDPAVPDTY